MVVPSGHLVTPFVPPLSQEGSDPVYNPFHCPVLMVFWLRSQEDHDHHDLRLTILSSYSLPNPGCMLVYYRFPKMPSIFTSMLNVMPNKSSHVCFSHILHCYISLLIFRPIMTQREKMFAQRSCIFQVMGPVWNPGTLLFTPN